MIKLICEVLVGNIALLMFAGNVGDFMKEHALDKIDINKPGSYSCDFYSFPLFHIPFKKPDIDNDPLSAETMIQIRKHLQGKVNTISDKIVEFNIAIRADDFCQLTEHKTLEFYESIKTDETLFQEHVDNEIYLQQMKNSTNKWYNVEWRVGVMQLDKIPEYFEKARILLPFVAGALKNKLEMQLDAAKGEVFLYCKLPEQEFEEIEELYRIKWKDKGLL